MDNFWFHKTDIVTVNVLNGGIGGVILVAALQSTGSCRVIQSKVYHYE